MTPTDWNRKQHNLKRSFDAALVITALSIGGVGLALQDDLTTPQTRAAAWQALGAFVALFPVLITIYVAAQGNLRASKADEEANELRQVSIEQAQAMRRLADASEQQAQLLHAERLQAQELRLRIAEVPTPIASIGGFGPPRMGSTHHLVNFSAFPVLVESVQLLACPGTHPAEVNLSLTHEHDGGTGALLHPGELRHLKLDEARRVADSLDRPTLEYVLQVRALSHAGERKTVTFSLKYSNWDIDAALNVRDRGVASMDRA